MDSSTPLSKQQRLQLFLERLGTTPAACDHDEAMGLLATLLDAIEDEHSGVPRNPEGSSTDGRMYPPDQRFEYLPWERQGVRCYRQTAHATFVADNGAIEIRLRSGSTLGSVVFERAGADGRKVSDYESPA